MPWRHAFIDSYGISSCCQLPRGSGDLATWAYDPRLREIQQGFIDGQPPRQCLRTCGQQEQKFGRSLRTQSLEDYQHERFTVTDIDFVDYRASNVCNFRCRSCEPAFSNGIEQEVRKHSELERWYLPVDQKVARVNPRDHVWICNNLHRIRRLMLTGGEPTRIPEIKQILQEVLRQDRHDLQIMITTNGSFRDAFWKDITQKLPNLHWTVSIDGVGAQAELIRNGTQWSVVERNTRWLVENAHSIDINSVISMLNVTDLAPLLTWVRGLQNSTRPANGCRHLFYVITRPHVLAADNWPDRVKPQVMANLDRCLALDLDDAQQQLVLNTKKMISNSTHDAMAWQASLEFNRALDASRKEFFERIIRVDHDIFRD